MSVRCTSGKAPKDAGLLVAKGTSPVIRVCTFSPTPGTSEKERLISPEVIDLIDCTCNKSLQKTHCFFHQLKFHSTSQRKGGSENTEVLRALNAEVKNGFFTTTPSDCVLCIFYCNKNPRILKWGEKGRVCTWVTYAGPQAPHLPHLAHVSLFLWLFLSSGLHI